jgi:hypothetical protein
MAGKVVTCGVFDRYPYVVDTAVGACAGNRVVAKDDRWLCRVYGLSNRSGMGCWDPSGCRWVRERIFAPNSESFFELVLFCYLVFR